jgi:leucine-zipper-like transcriptional regulator 1
MGSNPASTSPSEDLCVLNDVRFFDLTSRRWLPASSSSSSALSEKAEPPTSSEEDLMPKARYAHLSAITSDRMFIIGGQDVSNIWMDEVYVYDLVQKRWAQRREYPRHCGSYRSVAVASEWRVRLPEQEQQLQQQRARGTGVMVGSPSANENKFTGVGASSATTTTTAPESLVHMPYSAKPTEEFPNDIFLYSNHNVSLSNFYETDLFQTSTSTQFTDVKREFDTITPRPNGDFEVNDRSQDITGTNFPPGLRFPSGAVLGTHLIVAGTYLAQTYQSFSIWALNLLTLTWTRIEAGSAISHGGGGTASGSWFRAVVHARANQLIVFGDRRGNLVDDYNKRLLCWDDVVVVDLEASGIYQPPTRALAQHAQQLGLSALEQGVLADFEIVCDDGRTVACSRKVLEERWPWFREQRKRFAERALSTAESLPATAIGATGAATALLAGSSSNVPPPPLPDVAGPAHEQPRADPRLTPRSLALSEPYPITLALVQYFYTLGLITPLQHAPAVLSQLLILANTYGLPHLEALVKHAMHRALSDSNSVGVYEVATLCSCRSLQIR